MFNGMTTLPLGLRCRMAGPCSPSSHFPPSDSIFKPLLPPLLPRSLPAYPILSPWEERRCFSMLCSTCI